MDHITTTPTCPLLRLPDELLESITSHLPPATTLALTLTSKHLHKIANSPIIWRAHCKNTWRHWSNGHDFARKLQQPLAHTDWRALFEERESRDRYAGKQFEGVLAGQQGRVDRIEKISALGYDAKEVLLRLMTQTPDDAEDVLARRFWAETVLARMQREAAMWIWDRVSRGEESRVEVGLGGFDLFVLGGSPGDVEDVARELDRVGNEIWNQAGGADFDLLCTRAKSLEIANGLRARRLVGNPNFNDYHALRNNFLSLALFREGPHHPSLPLQSVAIFCAIARRLGVTAYPSNYPSHVYAVVQPPSDATLDCNTTPPLPTAETEYMYMDPWRSSDEVPRDELTTRLAQMGVSHSAYPDHLAPAGLTDTLIRASRNIMNSVQEQRDRARARLALTPQTDPDCDTAWYAMLWSMLLVESSGEPHGPSLMTQHRRKQCLPYLAEHFQTHFPEDLGLVESRIVPMFANSREFEVLTHLVTHQREKDRNAPAPSPRTEGAEIVKRRVGAHFRHRRYMYTGMVVGWDFECVADPRWIQQMRVDELPRGRGQPFYNVVADDRSMRYVAEENVDELTDIPCESLMRQAGRWFRRWDGEAGRFVSNIRDEYPDD